MDYNVDYLVGLLASSPLRAVLEFWGEVFGSVENLYAIVYMFMMLLMYIKVESAVPVAIVSVVFGVFLALILPPPVVYVVAVVSVFSLAGAIYRVLRP